jgi:ABC-type transporter Mla MlaB component
MLKITRMNGAQSTRFKLEGKRRQPWIDELLAACKGHESGRNFELDLSGVSFVDTSSLIVLRDLIRRGAVITAKSSFISELLNEKRNS